MRLIDADVLAIATDKYYDDVCAYDTWPNSDVSDTILAIEHIIDDMPTVDAEPVRHGRWVKTAHRFHRTYEWEVTVHCSECHHRDKHTLWRAHFPDFSDEAAHRLALEMSGEMHPSDYCPNCGAKMDGGAE